MVPADLLRGCACLLLGGAIGLAVWAGQETFRQWGRAIEEDLSEQLRRLRLSSKNLRTWMVAWVSVVVAIGLVIAVIFGAPLLAVLAAVVLLAMPWYLLHQLAQRRRERIEDQLADAMVSLSSSVRSGLSLPQSLEILARQCPHPIRQEFLQIHGEYQMGKALDICLQEAKGRLRSENFALFAAAVQASRQSGGKLNETVERIAQSVRELQRLERKIRAETAQARASALYMSLAPGFILAMYFLFFDPENTSRMFTELPGQTMLAIAALLNIVAWLWARKILTPEI